MKNIFTGITLGDAPRGDECKFKLINEAIILWELFETMLQQQNNA